MIRDYAAGVNARSPSPPFPIPHPRPSRTAPTSSRRLARLLDRLVVRHTAATSLADLAELGTAPGGGWSPTLYAVTGLTGVRHSRGELARLADAYDRLQAFRGDRRRAVRR